MKITEGIRAVRKHGSTKRGQKYILSESGKNLIEGKLDLNPKRKINYSIDFKINLPGHYSDLSNYREIKETVSALYSASLHLGRSRLEYVPIPKIKS